MSLFNERSPFFQLLGFSPASLLPENSSVNPEGAGDFRVVWFMHFLHTFKRPATIRFGLKIVSSAGI
jgi:hypothetical protein